jgi:pimeloyl-ACP methyl ester carboxylesterase
MQVIVDELLTHYEIAGEGKLVLLLHGWGDNLKGLATLQAALASTYQVLALDLPGFGQTQAPKSAWDLDDYATFVENSLKKIEAGDTFSIVGHSNGGALAIRSLAIHKLTAEKLVLLAASGIREGRSIKLLLLKVLATVGKIATVWMPRRYRNNLRKSLYKTAGSDALVVEGMRETFDKVVRQDVQQDAAGLSLPTLLIYAENDDAVPLSDGRKYNQLIKSSELVVVPGAGHFLHLDEPQIVVTAIEGFLA